MINSLEASRRLGISQSRLSKLIRGERIKAEKLGRDWYVSEAELLRFASVARRPGRPTGWRKRRDS